MFSGRTKELDPNLKPEEVKRMAYAKAIQLLAPREHSSAELSEKLRKNGFDESTIAITLEKVIELGYQSDDRFANLYAESLLRKHHGPLSIRAKLSSRGIDSSLCSEAIANLNAQWDEIAAQALVMRFSLTELSDSDQNQKGKVARFLQRRGFSTTDSIRALRLAVETVSD